MENAPANPLFTEMTTAKIVWLVMIVGCTLAVLIRGIRRKKIRDKDDPSAPPGA